MKISEMMTRDVVVLRPEDSVLHASELFSKHGFDGFPVVDTKGTLIGLVSQSDLVTKETYVHIPTLLKIFNKFDLYKKDRKFIKREIDSIKNLKVKEIMNTEPPLLYEDDTDDVAIVVLSKTHGVSPVSVVTVNRILKGVLARGDMFKKYNREIPEYYKKKTTETEIRIENFLSQFQKDFLFISRQRTKAWLLINMIFLVMGVTLALAIFF